MARKRAAIDGLTKLFDGSSRPVYAIDAGRRIVYCNRALADWLEMDPGRIAGRLVEYHSEPPVDEEEAREDGPLADLCPPPQALVGEACTGTLSCMARDGRLVHRRAEFVPLDSAAEKPGRKPDGAPPTCGVLAILAAADLSPQELATGSSADPTADELHRTIRRFRKAQASRYSIESLLGTSLAMQKVRAQLAAAAASGANTLICGAPGSGRGHAARAIHYCAARDAEARLLPIDCRQLTDDLLRRVLERLREAAGGMQRPTLLLENLEQMPAAHQSLLSSAIDEKLLNARIIATYDRVRRSAPQDVVFTPINGSTSGNQTREAVADTSLSIDASLLAAVSTITIDLPPLSSRLEDLPVLAHYFLEACNQGSGKQVGALRSDALDQLALYSWPGELDQLQEVVAAAHRAATSHEISPVDLPSILQHASQAAQRVRREPERIVLDELLGSIEKEVIMRALSQAGGNKSEAAALLGMTRPRLYRRLVQLGMVPGDGPEAPPEEPEFIERDPAE
jgi:DNA-binding NtrC family response regulator